MVKGEVTLAACMNQTPRCESLILVYIVGPNMFVRILRVNVVSLATSSVIIWNIEALADLGLYCSHPRAGTLYACWSGSLLFSCMLRNHLCLLIWAFFVVIYAQEPFMLADPGLYCSYPRSGILYACWSGSLLFSSTLRNPLCMLIWVFTVLIHAQESFMLANLGLYCSHPRSGTLYACWSGSLLFSSTLRNPLCLLIWVFIVLIHAQEPFMLADLGLYCSHPRSGTLYACWSGSLLFSFTLRNPLYLLTWVFIVLIHVQEPFTHVELGLYCSYPCSGALYAWWSGSLLFWSMLRNPLCLLVWVFNVLILFSNLLCLMHLICPFAVWLLNILIPNDEITGRINRI